MVGSQSHQSSDELAFGVHDFYNMYWDEPKLQHLNEHEAKQLGFSSVDSKVLSEVGIPEWAAPNLSFCSPELQSDNTILIGEDGEGRAIFYRGDDRGVYVQDSECVKLISVGLDGLIFTLVIYAAMVELAIECDRDAFRLNRVPLFLIDRLRVTYCAEFGGLYKGGFIEEEIIRLSHGLGNR